VTSNVDSSQTNDLNRVIASDADPYIAAVLNLWPPESNLDPEGQSLWRGALAIAIAGVATIALLGVLILQIGHGALAAIWMAVGLPLVLLATAAVRFSAGRLGPARKPPAWGNRRIPEGR
jgi:hypothetical protein